MNRTITILRNVASNWAGFAINAVVTLMLTPFVLRQLGTGRYGIWILTSSVIGYYGFLDVGFRAGVTQYLTRYIALGDYEKGSQCLSTAVAVLASVGVLILGLSAGAAVVAPRLFSVPPDMAREAFWCILIVGSGSAVQFALNPFAAVFTATQRFDLANAIGVGSRVLTAVSVVAALRMGYGLVGVSVATCAASSVDYIVRWRVARWLVPALQISRAQVSRERLREIGAFGAWNFLIAVNGYVYQYVPNFLIAAVLPIAAVGHYALATGLTRQINSILSPIGQVIYPAAAQLHIQGDRERFERLYHDGSRLMLLVMTAVVLPAFFWAGDFYRLWIGEKFLSGVPFQSVAVLFQILLLSIVTSYSSSIAGQLLIGAGQVRTVALSLLAGSVINLGLSLVLLRFYGLAGVAAATVIASIAIDLIAMPVLVQRELGLSLARYVRRACARPAASVVLEVLLLNAIRLIGPPQHWLQLVLQGALAGLAIGLAILTIGLNSVERQRFLVQPSRRLARRVLAFA